MTQTIGYQPDEGSRKRLEEAAAKKPPVTVDKPISFRVGRTRPGTMRHHYNKKRREIPDLRNPTYY